MSVDRVVLLERGGLRLSLDKEPDPAAVDLLCSTLWGSPGGIRYQHLDTCQGIAELPGPSFLQLHKGDTLMGVLALSDRPVRMGKESFHASYIRYFAVRPSIQRKTDAHEQKSQEARDGILRRAAQAFFDAPEAQRQLHESAGNIFYAYVTLDNARSQAMCASMGFSQAGTFKTHVFSRMFPRKSAQVRRIKDSEREETEAWIRETYKDHCFWTEDVDRVGKDYWVAVEQGKVVAGAQIRQVHWRMVDMPGWTGKLLIRFLPKIPFIRRLINPDRFHFLAADAIICKQGKENQFFRLLSHVCAVHGMNSVMIWRDEKDLDWQRIRAGGRMGILGKLNHSASIHVITKGLPIDWDSESLRKPIYVWPSDVV